MITATLKAFKYNEQLILKDIESSFETGCTHGIVGLNGAGKTTFFKLLAGLIKNKEAIFLKNGHPLLKSGIAFIDTDLFFYPKLTAKEFLSVFTAKSPTYNEEKLVALFKIPLDGFMEEFSTGMKKKLLILSQLKQDKDLYILDEPFNGLDLETNKILEIIITILNQRGKTVFISSHILDPLLAVCTQIHYIKDQVIFKSYSRHEFKEIEEELFGNYSRALQSELPNML